MAKKVDELVIRYLQQQTRKERKINIYDNLVKIGDRFYKFTEWNLLKGKFHMFLPTTFEIIFNKEKRMKVHEDMADIIITNSGTSALSLKIFENYEIDTIKNLMKELLNKCEANVLIDESDETGDKIVKFIDYKITAGFEDLYVFMFFSNLDENVVMGTFTCCFKDHEHWKEALLQIIKTIKTIK